MKCNIGDKDKNMRLGAGILLLLLGVIFKSWWGLFGLVLILTALVGFCPAYVLFKTSTVKKNKPQAPAKKQVSLKDAKKKGK